MNAFGTFVLMIGDRGGNAYSVNDPSKKFQQAWEARPSY
jgi:hypothetical protein